MDYGHEQTDLALKKLEKKLSSEYSKAAKTVGEKLTAHLDMFKKLDAQYSQRVADGKMDQSKYLKWRKTAMMTGKKWQDTREVLVSDMNNANKIAIGIINDSTIDAYALNMNYGTYEVESGTNLDTSFTLYDHATVENLMKDDPQIIPKARLDIPKDKLWNRQKLTSAIAQGILTGDSIPEIANRLTVVAGMNASAAIRNARTYTTAAENKGRVDSYHRAEDLGIALKQEWMATLDMRTRSSHRHLDGEKVEVGKKFSNGLRYPGDPDGPPWEIYNCRCTLVAAIDGFDESNAKRFSRLPEEGMTYEEWKNWRGKPEQKDGQKVIDGKDISATWMRRPDKFDFEIEDVINAQGFDGLPRILKGKAFDDAVKAANGGNGFIAQRTYSAPDMDTLNAYRDQLYRGKWYVDCSTGGAQYGKGMYCAADYTGTMTPGIHSEMEHYIGAYSHMGRELTKDEWLKNAETALNNAGFDSWTGERRQLIMDWADAYYDRDHSKSAPLIGKIPESVRHNVNDILSDVPKNAVQPHYIETLTLDPSAKIIKWEEVDRMMSFDREHNYEWFNTINYDEGVYAALKGYDAIDASGHGASGSYTVILNRTKLIIKGD